VGLVNPEGHQLVPDLSKPLPLGGPLGQLKAVQYLDFGLKELVSSLWIESEREYDISAAYDKLDHMVKDFKLYEYNLGMDTRIWFEDDRRRSKDFIEVIERRLKIQRIFRSLESFVGGRLRDVDYRLIQRTK
ncbi:hypothetical protein Tco_1279251, partial [Tanacetum coccineum]